MDMRLLVSLCVQIACWWVRPIAVTTTRIVRMGKTRRAAVSGLLKNSMMTSSNRNIFRVTGPSCWEFIGNCWIPLTKARDADLWCLFETPSWPLWHHCKVSQALKWNSSKILHFKQYGNGVLCGMSKDIFQIPQEIYPYIHRCFKKVEIIRAIAL